MAIALRSLVVNVWHSVVKERTVPLLDEEAELLPHPPADHLLQVPGMPGLGSTRLN